MTGKIPQRRDDLRQAGLQKGRQGRTWGAIEKGSDGPSPLSFDSLSPHSVCKKSPNLLAALLPLPDLNLTQHLRWLWPCDGKGGPPPQERMHKIL